MEILRDKNGKEFLILWGGGDVDPSFYGQEKEFLCGETNIKEDEKEFLAIENALKNDMPIIGICRGAQVLCVADGGELIQHIPLQSGIKPILVKDNTKVIECSIPKSHHQVCVPNSKTTYNLAYSIISSDELVTRYGLKDILIPEVIYFRELNAIGIQGHPEWDTDLNSTTNQYLFSKIKKCLNLDLASWKGH